MSKRPSLGPSGTTTDLDISFPKTAMVTPFRNLIFATSQILLACIIVTVAISLTSVDAPRANLSIAIYWLASGVLWSVMAYSTYKKHRILRG